MPKVTNIADHRQERCLLISANVHNDYENKRFVMIIDVKEVYRKAADHGSISELIGCKWFDACGHPDDRHAAYCDDEGWINKSPGDVFMAVRYKWNPNSLVGNVLITGFDPGTGDSCDATLTVQEVRGMIGQGKVCIAQGEGG